MHAGNLGAAHLLADTEGKQFLPGALCAMGLAVPFDPCKDASNLYASLFATGRVQAARICIAPATAIIVINLYAFTGSSQDPSKMQSTSTLLGSVFEFAAQFREPVLIVGDCQANPWEVPAAYAAFGGWTDAIAATGEDQAISRPDTFSRVGTWDDPDSPSSSIDMVLLNQAACQIVASVQVNTSWFSARLARSDFPG